MELEKETGQLQGENIWTGLKKGLKRDAEKEPLDKAKLLEAEAKADATQDIRFWFGRYQGLRKEDYCGLRCCDIDLDQGVLHLKQCQWAAPDGKIQKRNLNLKKKGERIIPIHSEVLRRLKEWMPEAATNNSNDPIWADDYRATIESWGSRFAENFSPRYGFNSHELPSGNNMLVEQNTSP